MRTYSNFSSRSQDTDTFKKDMCDRSDEDIIKIPKQETGTQTPLKRTSVIDQMRTYSNSPCRSQERRHL
jgi:hypothetical protein